MKNSELAGAPILQRHERRGSEMSEHVGRLRARAADRLAPGDMAIDPAGTVRPVDEEFSPDSVYRSPLQLGEHGRAFGAVVSRGIQLAEGLVKGEIDVDASTEASDGQARPLDEIGQSPDKRLVFIRPGNGAGHAFYSSSGIAAAAAAAPNAWLQLDSHCLPLFALICKF